MAKKRKNGHATVDASAYDYKTLKVRGKDGKLRHSIGKGDAVHNALSRVLRDGKDLAQVVRANKLALDPKKYANAGMFRMTLGNSLRAMIRNGTPVVIGDVTVKTLTQRVSLEQQAA
jgi:hypothetical protein